MVLPPGKSDSALRMKYFRHAGHASIKLDGDGLVRRVDLNRVHALPLLIGGSEIARVCGREIWGQSSEKNIRREDFGKSGAKVLDIFSPPTATTGIDTSRETDR